MNYTGYELACIMMATSLLLFAATQCVIELRSAHLLYTERQRDEEFRRHQDEKRLKLEEFKVSHDQSQRQLELRNKLAADERQQKFDLERLVYLDEQDAECKRREMENNHLLAMRRLELAAAQPEKPVEPAVGG